MSGVIVYTTIFGESDSLKAAPSGASRCVCFVDDPSRYLDTRGWEIVQHKATYPRRAAWHLRSIPHLLFPNARKTVWIDASFTLTRLDKLMIDSAGYGLAALRHHARSTCYEEGREIVAVGQASAADVSAQMEQYRREGFAPSSLSISCILVRENTEAVANFNRVWDEEVTRHAGDNTQLSLDYAAWKTGVGVRRLRGVRKDNPYAVHAHEDHKKRRKPYASEVAA